MNKKIFTLIVVLIVMLLFKINVQAECTSEELQALKIEANNLQFQYELKKNVDEIYTSKEEYFVYEIKVYNMTKNLFIYGSNTNVFEYSDVNSNGFVSIGDYIPGSDLDFDIRSSNETKCFNTSLVNKKVSLPYYNEYSERKECENFKEYAICKTNTNTSNITEEQFINEIDKIKNKEKSDQQNNQSENQKNNEQKVKKNNNKTITAVTIGVICLTFILIVIMFFIYRKRKKEKIKLVGGI